MVFAMRRRFSFALLLMTFVFTEAQAGALEYEFDRVCERLIEEGWLAEHYEQATVALDYKEAPFKETACDGSGYAELIVTAEDEPYRYAFSGKLECEEDLAACIAACGGDDAPGIARSLYQAYQDSRTYQEGLPSNRRSSPSGSMIREDIRYDLSDGWLTILNLEADRRMRER